MGWWPGPRFDGPSVFSSVLDPDAGHFSVAPSGGVRSARRAYLDGTLVLRTELRGDGGVLVVTDALALEPGARGHDIGHRSPQALVRVLEAVDGDVDAQVELVPRPEYGLTTPRVVRGDGVVHTAGGAERVTISGAQDLDVQRASVRGTLRLRAGQRRALVVRRGDGMSAPAPAALDGEALLDGTVASWRSWTALHDADDEEPPLAAGVRLAARVLQGLTYQPSGAVVAAATTSFPEVPGGEANWDYRFGWLRDASLVGRALRTSMCDDECGRYFGWMARAADGCRHDDHVQVLFGVEGERFVPERSLEHLAGVGGARPVRVGNAAWEQRQLDVLGWVLDLALLVRDHVELDAPTRHFLVQCADRAAEEWQRPDAGVWEAREGERHFTVSKALCWVALDRAVQLARDLRAGDAARRWARERDRVRVAVLEHGWSERLGAFAGELDGAEPDAATLLLPLVGLVEPTDPRARATAAVVAERLGDGGLVRRWASEEGDEAAFLPASFWLAELHARAGSLDAAHAVFAAASDCANDLGLLGEMADPATGGPLGNVPQALSHVGLVNAATAIGEAERRARAGGEAPVRRGEVAA